MNNRASGSTSSATHTQFKNSKDRSFEINGKTVVKKTMWTKGGTEFMNGAMFTIEATHGCFQFAITKNAYLVNASTILFLSGKHLVIYDILSRKQKIIMKAQSDSHVTCMKFYQKPNSPNSSIHVALGLKTLPKAFAQAKVYKSKHNKSLTLIHSHLPQSAEIVDIEFLFQKKKLVTIARIEGGNGNGSSNWSSHLSVWTLNNESCVCSSRVDFEIAKLIRAPLSEDEFLSMNAHHVHLWHNKNGVEELENAEYRLKCLSSTSSSSSQKQVERIVDMTFLEGTPFNAIISTHNVLYLSKANNLIQAVPLLAKNFPTYNAYCTCVTSMKRGFGVGFGGGFNGVHVYRLDANMEHLIFDREICIEPVQSDLSKLQIQRTISIQCDKEEKFLLLTVVYNKRESSTQQYKKQKKIEFISTTHEATGATGTTTVNNNNNNNNTLLTLPPDTSNQSNVPTAKGKRPPSKQQILQQQQQRSGQELDFQFENIESNQRKTGGRIEILLFDFSQLQSMEFKFFERNFEPIFEFGVLNGSIVDIAVCPSKNAVLIISEDNQLLIFELTDGSEYKCKFLQTFSERMYSISIHPLYIQIAIGFKEELKIGYLVGHELVQAFSDPLKMCYAVRYNVGGNLLAAASYSNINIYSPFTFEILFVLANTSAVSAINSLRWSDQDTLLTSSCVQGTLQCWNVTRRQKVIEHASKAGSKFSCLMYDSEFDLIIRCTLDHKLKIFSEKGSSMVYELDVSPSIFTSVLLIKEMNVILFGTNTGSIRMYLWPFDMGLKAQEFLEIPIHQTEVRSLGVSKDFTWIFSGSSDGDIFFLSMQEFEDGLQVSTRKELRRRTLKQQNMASAISIAPPQQQSQQQPQKQPQLNQSQLQQQTNAFIAQETRAVLNKFFDYTDNAKLNEEYTFLMKELCAGNQTGVIALKDELKELEFRINDMTNDLGDKKQREEAEIADRIEEIKCELQIKADTHGKEIEEEQIEIKSRIEVVRSEIEVLRMNFESEVQKIETESNNKLLEFYEQYAVLSEKKRIVSEANHIEINSNVSQCLEEKEKKTRKYEAKYESEMEQYNAAMTKIKINEIEFNEIQRQEAEEFQEYLDLIKEKLILEKKVQTKHTEELRTSNTKKQKGIEGFLEKKQLAERQIFELKLSIDQQENSVSLLQTKQSNLMSQLKEKEAIINTKEQEIQFVRSKNQHLQNFRAVYDYKVQILYDEQDPLHDHLADIEKKMKDLYQDLLKQAKRKEQVEKKVGAQEIALVNKKGQFQKKKELIQKMNYKIDSFQFEINSILKKLEFENWLHNLSETHEKYFGESNNVTEFFRQRNLEIGWKDTDKQNPASSTLIPITTTTTAASPTTDEPSSSPRNNLYSTSKKATTTTAAMPSLLTAKAKALVISSDQQQEIEANRANKDPAELVSANQQNLFLLSECNKLVKERRQLQEDLQKLHIEYKSVQTEANKIRNDPSASNNPNNTSSDYDIANSIDYLTNPGTITSRFDSLSGASKPNRFFSPVSRPNRNSEFIRDSSAGSIRKIGRNISPNPQQITLWDQNRVGSPTDIPNNATQKHDRLLKDMKQFKKAINVSPLLIGDQYLHQSNAMALGSLASIGSAGTIRKQQSPFKQSEVSSFRDSITLSDEPLAPLVKRNITAAHFRKVKKVSSPPPPPPISQKRSTSPKQKTIKTVQAPFKIQAASSSTASTPAGVATTATPTTPSTTNPKPQAS